MEELGLWSTSQLSLWNWSLPRRSELSFCYLLSKVLFYILSTLYIEHCLSILPLFVAICEIWLPGLTYDVYLVLFVKPGATPSLLAYINKWAVPREIICVVAIMKNYYTYSSWKDNLNVFEKWERLLQTICKYIYWAIEILLEQIIIVRLKF